MIKPVRSGADLHMHSFYSDGSLPPRKVMEACAAQGLEIASLTDHDTVEGLREAEEAAGDLGIEFVPGCEISVDWHGQDLHLLGYFLDAQAAALTGYLRAMEGMRRERVGKVVERLRGLGVEVTMESVLSHAKAAASVGRPHVAQALVANGFVSSYHEAFARYLGDRAPAFVPKETASLPEVLAVVRGAGGCAVLAHPGIYDLTEVVPEMERLGLAGLEVHHPSHSPEQIRSLLELAEQKEWVATGGSDFHGIDGNDTPVGSHRVAREVVEELKRRTPR